MSNRSKKHIILFLAYICIISVLSGEAASRLFWFSKYDVPLLKMDKIIYVFYPELRDSDVMGDTKEEGTFNILFLGGSVLQPGYSIIDRILKEELTYRSKKDIKIYNMAVSGHTSLDSFYKYKYLKNKSFDLVIFYHGINETRANNSPPSLYDDDYLHYSWYRNVDSYYKRKRWIKTFSLPFTMN